MSLKLRGACGVEKGVLGPSRSGLKCVGLVLSVVFFEET